jgi:hypothetical protein
MGATAGVATGDEADDSGSFDEALSDDEASAREDVAAGSALEQSAETIELPGSPGTAAADLTFDLSPAPMGNGTISWTGLAPAAAPIETSSAAPIEAPAETPIEAATERPAQVEPTAPDATVVATDATEPAATAAAAADPAEKKVVWSSSPSERYTSFGSGPRRDDY